MVMKFKSLVYLIRLYVYSAYIFGALVLIQQIQEFSSLESIVKPRTPKPMMLERKDPNMKVSRHHPFKMQMLQILEGNLQVKIG